MKALLPLGGPLGGIPLALLVAKRAMNGGRPLTLATSVEESDDRLAAIFEAEGIPIHRGSLDDPLARFEGAASALSGDDLVVRITGDNPLPDGAFIEALIREREVRGLDYLRVDALISGLPYGVSAEIFRVSLLREAARRAISPFDREHITPFIRREAGDAALSPGSISSPALAALRATIDSARDYERMTRVFEGVADPIHAPLGELIARLREIDRAPPAALPLMKPRLSLGTAQLGLDYGVANRDGKPSDEEAFAILEVASRARVDGLDTARAYGDAERRIGEAFAKDPALELAITTKLAPLGEAADGEALADAAELSLFRSLHALARPKIEGLLFHRAGDLERFNHAALRRVDRLKREGYLERIGISAQSPEEASRALQMSEIGEIQFPMNLLDARFDAFVEEARARPEVKLVARSVFLQGLLLIEDGLPSFEGVDVDMEALGREIDEIAALTQSSCRLELAIRFLRAFSRLDAIVVGAETSAQLGAIIEAFTRPPLMRKEVQAIRARFGALPVALLDPAKWKYQRSHRRQIS